MADHNDFGKFAEEEAVEFLQNLNYEILKVNWRFQKAEVDIICIDHHSQEIVFVEVKARKSIKINAPENAVNAYKKKLLVFAANEFSTQHAQSLEVRFDIVSMVFQKDQWIINHIKNAFNAYE